MPSPGTANSVYRPVVVSRPTPTSGMVNQSAPSGPDVMSWL